MIIHNEKGDITITAETISQIAGYAAINCFGVRETKGGKIAPLRLFRKDARTNGVEITEHEDGEIGIDLHITVMHGVNIRAACESIISEVRYHVSRLTGLTVKNIKVHVEAIKV